MFTDLDLILRKRERKRELKREEEREQKREQKREREQRKGGISENPARDKCKIFLLH